MDWTDQQVRFWYGGTYEAALLNDWTESEALIQSSDFRSRVHDFLRIEDISEAHVRFKYRDWGAGRFPDDVGALIDIVNHDEERRLSGDHIFPIRMVDGIGPNLPIISYNRSSVHPNMLAILWPWSYHFNIAVSGLRDLLSFDRKKSQLFFRGSLSGPVRSYIHYSHFIKPSRLEVVSAIPKNDARFDVGLTSIPDDKVQEEAYSEAEPLMKALMKPGVPADEFLKYKYVLCMEGGDIASGFGAALASHSVPFHPFPFCYHVWYFSGLEPWVHFVPVRPDGQNIESLFEFCSSNIELMRSISAAGRDHMRNMLSGKKLGEVKRKVVSMWNLRG